jgi:hypothetical protein
MARYPIARVAPPVQTPVVAGACNPGIRPIFSEEERVALLRDACREWHNVMIEAYRG